MIINWQNQKTYDLINIMNPNLKFDDQKTYPQYRDKLNNRHKVVQLVKHGKTKEFFEYVKKHGKFLGYSIYERRCLGGKNGFDTIIQYIYLCNNYYCTVEFNKSIKYSKYDTGLTGSRIGICK